MGRLPEVLLLGSICRDRIMRYEESFIPHLQGDPAALSLSLLVHKMTETYGGTAVNIAYTLALLGDSSTLLTAVGEDAKQYLGRLSHMGINTNHVKISHLPTASFTCATDNACRQIGFFYPGAMQEAREISLSEWVQDHPLVVQSAHDPEAMAKHVSEAHNLGFPLIYDAGQQVSNVTPDDLEHGLEAAHVLMLNEHEMAILSRRTNQSIALINSRVPIVVTTLGENGSLITGSIVETDIHIPAVRVETIVDPTGAGDAYRSGFLHGYRRGKDLRVCGQMGSCAASFAVEHQGTQTHSFDQDAFLTRY